jgi:hypothetical protein
MKRYGSLLMLLLAPLLTACPPPSYVTLFNNSDLSTDVHASGDNATVAPKQFVRFQGPFVRGSHVFRLSSGGCEYLYDLPPDLRVYETDPYSRRGVQIQVEQDFSVNLLPPSYAGDAPASGEILLRREGFPLKPVARKCG